MKEERKKVTIDKAALKTTFENLNVQFLCIGVIIMLVAIFFVIFGLQVELELRLCICGIPMICIAMLLSMIHFYYKDELKKAEKAQQEAAKVKELFKDKEYLYVIPIKAKHRDYEEFILRLPNYATFIAILCGENNVRIKIKFFGKKDLEDFDEVKLEEFSEFYKVLDK